ncbi:MAG: hypothetical protein ACYCXB_01250 [Candidatus Humimicrobiaceae bacterium]
METNNNYIPPLIIMGAEPSNKITPDNFFVLGNNPLYNLLKNPPYLRYSGWNLLTLDLPKISDGKCWEVKNGDRKTIRLYRDGSLIAIAYADDSFLGWGQDHNAFLRFPLLNSLAIIEYTYEFVELYKNLLENLPKSKKVKFKVGIKNANSREAQKLYLKPYEVTAFEYRLDYNDSSLTPVTSDFYEIVDVFISDEIYNSRYIAFQLVSVFFLHFNIPIDKIPYTKKDDKGIGYVDIDKIISNR